MKRSIGEYVIVTAGLIIDGHDKIAAEVYFRHEADDEEQVRRMQLLYNDEYHATFSVDRLGLYHYRVRAWVDQFATWQDQFRRRVDGGDSKYEIENELKEGAAFLRSSAQASADREARQKLGAYAELFERGDVEAALTADVLELARDNDPRDGAVESRTYDLQVDPELARFAAWYEYFPRSAGSADKQGAPVHATLDEAAEILPRIKDLGFDVVYLPPVHPIGSTNRKGKDNAPEADLGEPGSPWAIGSNEGGHKAVHPDLGGMEAFDRYVARAESLGLKVAL
ncbi:MAG: maltotransferase domain-containing protein, partial [Rhodothermales bacterium]